MLLVVAVAAAVPERPALLPGVVALAVVTPTLVVVDVREHRLPNRLVGVGAAGVLLAWLSDWSLSGGPNLAAILAAAAVAGGLLLLAVFGGLGMGDVKLGAVLAWAAALVDPSLTALGLVLGVFIGGIQSAIVLVRTRDRRRSIAFGPALLAGYWLPVVWLAVTPG